MQESAGKRLSTARLAQGLSIDDVAHSTRIRPDKIAALEGDDYSRFGSNAYARGFLVIYGRLLNVDVSEEVRLLQAPHALRVRDYQYLNNAEAPKRPQSGSRIYRRPSKPSVIPLLGFVLLLILGGMGFYFYTASQRLGAGLAPAPAAVQPEPAPEPAPETPKAAPGDVSVETPAAEAAEAAAPVVAESVEPVPAAVPEVAPAPAPTEITVVAKKKTWVTIRQDDPKSRPVFAEFLYPKAAPLKFQGGRVFIETRTPENIEIRKNGDPVPYAAGNPIE